MTTHDTPVARRISVPDTLRDLSTVPRPNYASAFAVEDAGRHSAEQWARSIFEKAPSPLRWFLVTAWIGGLGLRISPRFDPTRVLGWDIATLTPDTLVIAERSWLVSACNVVHVQDSTICWATFVHYEHKAGRAVWSIAAPIHHRAVPFMLRRAAREPQRS